MTTRGEINSNFYQIVNVDANGAPTDVKPEYLPEVGNAVHANVADVANSVSVGNVTGIGNIATINLNNSSTQVLYGNGVWAGVSAGTTANYANYAGNLVYPGNEANTYVNLGFENIQSKTQYSLDDRYSQVDQTYNSINLNVTDNRSPTTSTVNLLLNNSSNIDPTFTITTTTSAIGGGTPHNWVFNGGGTLTLPGDVFLPGNTFTFYYANGSQISLGGDANYANFAGNVTISDQPNITSLGTLVNLTVDGNLIVNYGNVQAPYFIGDGGLLSNITGSNVTGQVSNALVAGTVYTNAQPNITSLGTLTSLTVTGNISSGNANLGNLAIANFFSGDGGLLSNIQAANVVGTLSTLLSVKNTSGGSLSKGTPVYATGTVGATSVLEVSASRADTSSTMGCIGMLSQTLAVNATGYAVQVGEITSINTNGYTIGQELYVAPTGGYTNVRPTGANIVQPIGTVVRVNASTGQIEVNIWDIVRLPNLDNGNIWVGTTGNGAPVQAVLNTANVGNSNFASYAGNVTIGAQPNITSTGTLISLNVTGNISSGNANLGNLTTSNYFSGNGSLLTGIVASAAGNTSEVQFNNSGSFAAANSFTFNNSTQQPAITLTAVTGTIGAVRTPTINFTTTSGTGNIVRSNSFGGSNALVISDANAITLSATTVNLGSNSNVKITGGSSTQLLVTDGLGNLSWSSSAPTAGTVTTNAQPNITSTGTLTSLTVSGTGNIGNLVLNKYNELLPASANTSTSITPDLINGSIFRYTANASFTFNSLANAVSGSSAVVVITQGGAGSYTLTSTMKFAGGAKTLSTAVGAIDIISVFYDGTTYYATLSKGYS